jgi:hypothetical protein
MAQLYELVLLRPMAQLYELVLLRPMAQLYEVPGQEDLTVKTFFITACSLFALTIPAVAEEICYEDVPYEASLSCGDHANKRSADFSVGCQEQPAGFNRVPVECPPTKAVWVNVTGGVTAGQHDAFCKSKGYKGKGDVDGQVCASGLNIPVTGEGWESINYHSRSQAAVPYGSNSILSVHWIQDTQDSGHDKWAILCSVPSDFQGLSHQEPEGLIYRQSVAVPCLK